MTAVFDWTICPEAVVESNQRRAVQVNQDRGHSRGREINERPLRRWTLTYSSTDLILDEVERAWAATYGPVLSLNFTPPGGSSLEVRFAENTLRRMRESVATGSVTITLEEIR